MKVSITLGPDSVLASTPCCKCGKLGAKPLEVPKGFRYVYSLTRGMLQIPPKQAAVYDYEIEGAYTCQSCMAG